MVIVILNKRPLKRMRYHELFPKATLHLLTSTNHTSLEEVEAVKPHYSSITVFEQYDGNGEVEKRILEISREQKIDRLIALSEQDILRAARIRDHLDINGMRYHEALGFRDKVIMKERLSASKIPVPNFAKLSHASDAWVFKEKYGFPIVIKPIRGAGSMGVQVIRNERDLCLALAKIFTSDFDRETGYMIESFIKGNMYHVDGIVRGGNVLFARASQYVNSCLSFYEGGYLGSVMLNQDNARANDLIRLSQDTIQALNGKSSFAFHAEIFLCNTSQDFFVCEIGCRAGGGPLVDTIASATGVDLTRVSAQMEVEPNTALTCIENARNELRGWCLFPPQEGTLQNIPNQCNLAGTISYATSGKIGTSYTGGKHSIDCVASAIVTGQNNSECFDAIQAMAKWFYSNVVWRQS